MVDYKQASQQHPESNWKEKSFFTSCEKRQFISLNW
jgi:hypothetical protein